MFLVHLSHSHSLLYRVEGGEKIAKEIKHFPHDFPFTLMENETCRLLVD